MTDDTGLDNNPQENPEREIAAAALAAGRSYAETAAEAGRSKRTIVRWMAEPDFARTVADLRTERVSVVTGRLADLAPSAVDVLTEALTSEDPGVRLRAAHLTLDWSMKLRRATDLEARILEIEHRQGIRGDDGPAPSAEPSR